MVKKQNTVEIDQGSSYKNLQSNEIIEMISARTDVFKHLSNIMESKIKYMKY